jgi:hypothetical protein
MCLRIQSSKRAITPSLSSAVCGALLVALLVEPEVARAGDGLSDLSEEPGIMGSTSLLERVMPANENLAELEQLRRAAKNSASTSGPAARPAPRAAAATPTLRPPENDPSADTRPPIRLDARAMLKLNDLTLAPWITSSTNAPLFQSSGSRILGFEAGMPGHETAVRIDRSLSSSSGWLGDRIELSFNDGIAYRENFQWNGMQLRLKLWGPVIKGDPGLGMRLKGLQLSRYPVEVRARATTDLQDVQFRIDF